MSKKCVAFSKSKLGLETADNRKSFYAGWDAALAEQAEQDQADATSEPFLEVFYDPGYFDMWCVRDVHYKDYNHTIHVNSKESANHAKALIESWVRTYAAPVRTKDLTDDEIYTLYSEPCSDREMVEFARAVIAADREKNK